MNEQQIRKAIREALTNALDEGKIPTGLKKYMDDKKKGKKSNDKESDEKDDKKSFDGKPFGDDDGDDKPNVLDKEPKNADVQEDIDEAHCPSGKRDDEEVDEAHCPGKRDEEKDDKLKESFTTKKDQLLFEKLVRKWAK